MKELYVKPEVEILLPLCEDIMTSSGEAPVGPAVNPDEANPTGVDPMAGNTPANPPADTTADPDGDPDHSGGNVDEGSLS